MSNYLEGAIAYLSGHVTFAPDDGRGWRQEFIEKASLVVPKLVFYDPTNKPKGLGSEVNLEKQQIQDWKKEGEFEKVTKHVKKYRRYDLRMVDNSHFLILYIDTNIFTMGTFDEVYVAERQKKPILVIVEQGKRKAPDWLFAVCKHKEIFNNIDNCVSYLSKLDSGEIQLDNRWVLYNGKLHLALQRDLELMDF